VEQGPTGPRLYVQHTPTGEQGYIAAPTANPNKLRVAWLKPGLPASSVSVSNLIFILEEALERCPSGQTGEECGSGENQCELCLQAEDEEGDEIERSMGLR
jgi:hypothetical protein